MKVSYLLAFLLVSSFSFNTWAEIRFSSRIPQEQVNLLKSDLARLGDFLQADSAVDQELMKVMELNDLSEDSLRQWLEQRVEFVVSEDFDPFREFTRYANGQYPNPTTFPQFDEEENVAPITPPTKMITVMSNIGTAQYLIGKSERSLYSFQFDEKEQVLLSPRRGVVKIGEGLMHPKLNFSFYDLSRSVNSIMRLATLFHEARHSDGNGESLGFCHSVCPQGHRLQGKNACDKNLNGPYTLDSLLISKMAASCQDCTAEELQFLKLQAEDYLSRVLKSYRVVDFTPEVKKQLEELESARQSYISQWNNPNLSPRQEMMINNAIETLERRISRLLEQGEKIETVYPTTFWDTLPEFVQQN